MLSVQAELKENERNCNVYMYIEIWDEPGAESSQGSRHRILGSQEKGELESRAVGGGGSALADKVRL